MRKSRKKGFAAVILALLLYGLLLRLLVFAESFASGSGIRTFGDALWYSLVTMTTVGYGDLYPVTLGGKLIGAVFLFLSTGVLAVVLSLVAALLLGRMFPKLRLMLWRNRRFFVFDSASEEAILLSKTLSDANPAAVIVLCGDGPNPKATGKHTVFFKGSAEEALEIGRRVEGLFLLGPDSFDNLSKAGTRTRYNIPIYCESVYGPCETNAKLTLFNRYESTARLYWRQLPIAPEERVIVLVGMGEYGKRLLEQALLTNVFGAQHCLHYHVFGESGAFRREHTQLAECVSVDGTDEGRDSVFFHAEEWNLDQALLQGADRIIICTDDDAENLSILTTLRQRHPVAGDVHVRLLRGLDCAAERAEVFGTCETLFTPEMVMRQQLNRLARAMNGLYRAKSGGTAPDWPELPPFLRRSSMAAADHLLTKIRLLLPEADIRAVTQEGCAAAYAAYRSSLPERAELYRFIEHERWMRFLYLNNWRWAETRDNERRLHPLLLPFDRLSVEEQRKDDSAWELLGCIGEWLEA